MLVFGATWQQGLIPLSLEAITKAITLNGAGPERNLRAFNLGRWAMLHPAEVEKILSPNATEQADPIAFRAAHLREYGDEALAKRFLTLVQSAPKPLQEPVAKGYHKLLAIKDEYEVARLHLDSLAKAEAEFDGALRPTFHLAPPFMPGKDAQGRPKKRAFGPWIIPVFRLLAKMKPLRGGAFDVFGRSAERRMERALITEYEADIADLIATYTPAKQALAVEIAELPLTIRGFGPVKHANAEKAAARRQELLAKWRGDGGDGAVLAAE
jgi:indolepyruvate ferredoxin oxidoreductase